VRANDGLDQRRVASLCAVVLLFVVKNETLLDAPALDVRRDHMVNR
jgi:hypothetical protein